MPVQFSESAEDAMPTSRQDIRHISVTNGGMSFAGNFQNLTIANKQQGNSHTQAPGTLSLTYHQVNFKDKIKNCSNHVFVSHPDIDRESLASAKGQRAPGTCQWILDDPQYQSWLTGAFPVLRISGGPGKGKTIMSLFLAEEVETLCQQKGDHLLSYFCQFQDKRYNDPHNVLRNLIYQLLKFSQDEPQVDEILKYFETPEKKQSALGSLDCLWKILVILLSQPSLPSIFCIIDGIDECDSSEYLTSKFHGYCASVGQRSAESKFQLVMLGRDIDGPETPHVIKLDPDNDQSVRVDITTFIEYSLEPLMVIPGFAEIRPEITKTLSTRAEGTFLWVSFVIQELTKKKTCLQIQDAMKHLPKGLYPIFTRMLHAIDYKYQESSADIFKWVAFAERPLTLNDLAVATVDGQGEADGRTIADKVAICRPFLKVHQEKVFFVHQSAKEYLSQSQQGQNLPPPKFQLIPDQCHDIIAHKCLNAIENDFLRRDAGFKAWCYDHSSCREVLQSTLDGFLRYAIEYWSIHARLSATQTQWLSDLNRPFLRNLAMRNTYSGDIYEACLSKNSPDMVGRNDYLMTAAMHGDRAMVQLLMDRGANINANDYMGKDALMIAAEFGKSDMVQMLLDRGADIRTKDKSDMIALMYALIGCNESTLKSLLRCGADIIANMIPQIDEPLVYIAARKKSQFVIDLLLENHACVDRKGSNGTTSLICTIMGFTSNAVHGKSSPQHGFDFYMVSDGARFEPERGMHAAKQKDMMISLLQHGADVNLCGKVAFYEETFVASAYWNIGSGILPRDGKVILNAPPLVCAAALGIDWVVGLLVIQNVEAITLNNSIVMARLAQP
ncbi:unnamed protein product [Fusarium graminearum]|uniref:Nephrocystin 3-like N-terminal domain-containing protein n=1 Tax=Gibberella zeae TaxID=5518 RepID=A0A9N8RA09_GIBZA|nr:unnamed protein product [Fusarium graminearum]